MMRLLYVDDDRINALLFREACRLGPGLQVEIALNGAEALQLAGDWQPQVLVVDLHLPDTDGCTLLPQLRAAAGDGALPAFLCTADNARDAHAAAAAAGFTGCWPKPVDLQAMLADLADLASLHAPQPPQAG